LGLLDYSTSAPQIQSSLLATDEFKGQLCNHCNTFLGKQYQLYPPYSSVRIKGKALFQWAKEGKLNEVEIPGKSIEIHAIDLVEFSTISMADLVTMIKTNINNITSGEFRQTDILNKWNEIAQLNPDYKFPLATIHVHVSHGAYVRSISHEIGKKMGTGAVVIDLLRTRAGPYKLEDAMYLDERDKVKD